MPVEQRTPAENMFSTRRGEIRLDEHPTTEHPRSDAAQTEPPAEPEVKSGVALPEKVSQLRWKLGRKAK